MCWLRGEENSAKCPEDCWAIRDPLYTAQFVDVYSTEVLQVSRSREIPTESLLLVQVH